MGNQLKFMEVPLINCELGTEFRYKGEEFKLIYNNHAIMVGLTKKKHSGMQQAVSFPDSELVLVICEDVPLELSENGK